MSTPFHLLLPRVFLEEMLAQAKAELPNECCGLLAGQLPSGDSPRARVERRYPLVNAAGSPREYNAESRALVAAHRDVRQRGLEVLAIYHSHPDSPPLPSRTDRERSYGPGVVNFIISLQVEPAVVRGWWLEETGYREAEWECVD